METRIDLDTRREGSHLRILVIGLMKCSKTLKFIHASTYLGFTDKYCPSTSTGRVASVKAMLVMTLYHVPRDAYTLLGQVSQSAPCIRDAYVRTHLVYIPLQTSYLRPVRLVHATRRSLESLPGMGSDRQTVGRINLVLQVQLGRVAE